MAKLKLSEWSLIAEIVGGAAVIVSLFYLAYQLNQNTRITEASMRSTLAAQDIEFLSLRIDSSVVAIATTKKRNGEQLSAHEDEQLISLQSVNFRVFEHSYYQYQKGILEPEEWQRHENIAQRNLLTNEHAQKMWERSAGSSFSVDFVNHMNQKLEELKEDQ